MRYNPSQKPEKFIQDIFKQAVTPVMPDSLVRKDLSFENGVLEIRGDKFDLQSYDNLHIMGCGKGVVSFYEGFRETVDHHVKGGVLICPSPSREEDRGVTFIKGSHPLPDILSLNGGKAICSYAEDKVNSKDLVIFLLTGGASSLMVNPADDLNIEDIAFMNRLLLESGAEIEEINCVRKHMSSLKGGHLGELLYPADVVVLVLSDVIGSPLEAIGSGPLYGDSTTFEDVWEILKKYHILEKSNQKLIDYFYKASGDENMETPSPDSEKLKKIKHFILGDNFKALQGVKDWFEEGGLACNILTSCDSGEARNSAGFYCSILKEIMETSNPFKSPVVILAGGELTVTVKGKGKGGRNQEFVLGALENMKGVKGKFFIASFGTDGIDGPTDCAGAWIDQDTFGKTEALGLDIKEYLENNDAWGFFNRSGNLIKTGRTGTNVMDVRVFILGT